MLGDEAKSRTENDITDEEKDMIKRRSKWMKEMKEETPIIFERKLEEAKKIKEYGNNLFKQSNYENALSLYNKALFHITFEELSWNFELMDQHRDQVNEIRLPLLLNLCATALKIHQKNEDNKASPSSPLPWSYMYRKVDDEGNEVVDKNKDEEEKELTKPIDSDLLYPLNKELGLGSDDDILELMKESRRNYIDTAIDFANEALKIDSKNAKALYRRGECYLLKGHLEKAKIDLVEANKLQPNDPLILSALRKLKKEKMDDEEKEKHFWAEAVKKQYASINSESDGNSAATQLGLQSEEREMGIVEKVFTFIGLVALYNLIYQMIFGKPKTT